MSQGVRKQFLFCWHIKKYRSWLKKPRQDAYQQVEDGNWENEEVDDDNTSQTIWTSVPYYIKFKSRSRHNSVLNCDMPYLVALMMSGSEFSKNPENNQINLWPERNPMALDRMMVEVWNKWALELGHKKDWRDQDIADKLTRFEAHKVNIWFCRRCI